jgi:hypothetical protein
MDFGSTDYIVQPALALLHDKPDWEFQSEKDNVKFYMKKVPWCKPKACLFATFVPGVTPQLLEALITTGFIAKEGDTKTPFYCIDNLLDYRTCLGEYDEGKQVVVRAAMKSPFRLISPRETVSVFAPRTWLTEEQQKHFGLWLTDEEVAAAEGNPQEFERHVFVHCSRAVPKEGPAFETYGFPQVPESKGYVRATSYHYAWVAQRTPKGINLKMMYSADAGGSIPTSMIDFSNSEQIEKLTKVRQLMIENAA